VKSLRQITGRVALEGKPKARRKWFGK
jgi:hypothetical protein